MRIVVDAKIIVSAYTNDGPMRDLWRQDLGVHSLLISPEIFGEVERTLRSSGAPSSDIKSKLQDILDRCDVIRIKRRSPSHLEEFGDATYLADLACAEKVDVLLTYDERLLGSKKLDNVNVMKPTKFMEWARNNFVER